MPSGFRAAVYGEVLRSRNGLEVVRVVALQAGDEGHAETRREKGILAISLLASTPPRVAEDIDVGRPNGEAPVPVRGTVGAPGSVILGAKFRADGLGDIVHQ